MALKDQLESKPKPAPTPNRSSEPGGGQAVAELHVAPPQVTVEAPQVTVEAPQVTADMAPIAAALQQFAATIQAGFDEITKRMGDHDARVVQIANEQKALLEALAQQPAPTVKLPARPRAYEVEIDEEGGRMRIEVENSH